MKQYFTDDDLTYKNNSIQERLLVFDNRRKNNKPLSLEDLNILLDANWDFSCQYENIVYEIIHDKGEIVLYQTIDNNKTISESFKNDNDLKTNAKINNLSFLDVWINSKYK